VHAHRLPGPGDQQLLVRERRLILDTPGGGRALRLMVAIDQRELASARQAFAAGMLPYLGLMAAVLGGAIWLQLRIGLAPLESIRQGVGAIRSGSARRLPDDYPAEVMPLVQEVNALLAAREQAIERARGWTADLAHGLKTPLAALSADAGRLRAAGNEQAATDIEQLAADMRRRVDRELMRARLRAGAVDVGSGADLARAISKLLRTLQRTPDGEHLGWRVDIHGPRQVAVPEGDLLELLGNLLENAARFARTIVWIDELPSREDRVRLRIADDGPGVSAADLSRLGERGVRLDQAKGGSGLGLAIARDIVDAYGGALDLGIAAEGGLAVTIELPRPALGQR
jgi:signal transduction histidine kinase